MAREIPLSKGMIAIVDDDYDELARHRWHARKSGKSRHYYAARTVRAERRPSLIRMHHEVLGVTSDQRIDHINGNALDNRRANLRLCTNAQNQHNSGVRSDNTSGYKGVCQRRGGKWAAMIRHLGIRIYLGLFDNPVDAALAYDRKARELFGEFARPNFQ